ncbi:MAG: hypothetical protein C0467_25855, partial [Planctomycetaceae bacterium]|nr:hypothetical protein [Planctomycetaceae bacterium]
LCRIDTTPWITHSVTFDAMIDEFPKRVPVARSVMSEPERRARDNVNPRSALGLGPPLRDPSGPRHVHRG